MNPLRAQPNPVINQGAVNQSQFQASNPAIAQAGQTSGGIPGFIEKMIFNKLYSSNPNFKALADSVQGMSPEQAFQERGLDYNNFKNIDPNQVKSMLGF